MPRNPVSDIDHVVFTDHSIRRRPLTVNIAPSATADLVPYMRGAGGSTDSGARDLGLAYAMVGRREQNAVYLERAFQLLEQALAGGSRDVQTLAYLAEFYRERRNDAKALPLYEEVWRMDQGQYAAAAALGAYRMQRGDLEGAIRFWNQTLAISPALPLTRLNLATALLRTGQVDEARAILQKTLEFNPSFQEARDLLNQIAK
jgi:tetratricopeptide (TPR) repeat protein